MTYWMSATGAASSMHYSARPAVGATYYTTVGALPKLSAADVERGYQHSKAYEEADKAGKNSRALAKTYKKDLRALLDELTDDFQTRVINAYMDGWRQGMLAAKEIDIAAAKEEAAVEEALAPKPASEMPKPGAAGWPEIKFTGPVRRTFDDGREYVVIVDPATGKRRYVLCDDSVVELPEEQVRITDDAVGKMSHKILFRESRPAEFVPVASVTHSVFGEKPTKRSYCPECGCDQPIVFRCVIPSSSPDIDPRGFIEYGCPSGHSVVLRA